MNPLQAIQLMIAPVFMVSGCALLLSTSNNKSSSTINRLRLLSQEENNKDKKQILSLLHRIKFIRNAAFSFETAVGFFVASSLSIGATYFSNAKFFDSATIVLFMLGMTSVLLGVIFLSIESKKGYDIIRRTVEE